LECSPASGLLAHDQALVGELGQRGIYRSGTRPPGSAAALLDVGHDLVAVARALPQQRQDRGPNVAAAGLRTPRRACGTGRSRPPHDPLSPSPPQTPPPRAPGPPGPRPPRPPAPRPRGPPAVTRAPRRSWASRSVAHLNISDRPRSKSPAPQAAAAITGSPSF